MAITGQGAGRDLTGGDARLEHFAIPLAMLVPHDRSRIRPAENREHIALDGLERLPVAARRQRVAVLTIGFADARIPSAGANPLDQSGRDGVAFDR